MKYTHADTRITMTILLDHGFSEHGLEISHPLFGDPIFRDLHCLGDAGYHDNGSYDDPWSEQEWRTWLEQNFVRLLKRFSILERISP